MAYDPAFSDPSDPNSGDLADVALIIQILENALHNYRYKPELGPDAPTSPVTKIVTGTKTVSVITSNGGQADVNFAVDCDQGDPGFTNTPKTVITAVDADPIFPWSYYIQNNKSTSGFRITVAMHPSGGSYTSTITFDWIAIGN